MNIDKKQYSSIRDEIVDISKNYQDETSVNKFNEHIIKKLENFEPTIMVYGVYNAGKSTLLNAIFGKREMAKTGDSPETAEVTAYNYNGYKIYDTPGINAPIEHQRVTEEHLSKSELVIFVLSNNGSFEERYIYDRIGDIIKANKPILIAVNNKSGIDMDSTEAQKEIDKINQHLITTCDQMGIKRAEKSVEIAFVNALDALDGKVENEQELIDDSKIELFEERINSLLGKSSKTEVENTLNLYISDYIYTTLTLIDSKIDNPQLQKTQELITYLEKFKQRAYVELKEIAIEGVTIATANLLELLLSRDEQAIKQMIEKTISEINEKINIKLEQYVKELQRQIEDFKIDYEQLTIENPNMDTRIDEELSSNYTENSSSSSTIVGVTSAISKLIPSTLTIVSIPVAPLVIFVGTIISLFSGSDKARQQAQAQIDAQRAQHLNASNKSYEFGVNLKDKLIQNIGLNIDNIFSNPLDDFIKFANKLDSDNSKLLEDKKRLQTLLTTLQNKNI
jgi:GTP-binding protein EngB required for normal cell division